MLAEAGISAGVGVAIAGGSFVSSFDNALTSEPAASGAFAIRDAQTSLNDALGPEGGVRVPRGSCKTRVRSARAECCAKSLYDFRSSQASNERL